MKYWILILSLVAMSCNRKLHTTVTTDSISAELQHENDSLREVSRTLSRAYEDLFRTSSETGVIFDTKPCDTIVRTVEAATGLKSNEHSRSTPRIIIRPDGTKEITGPIKRFNQVETKQTEHRETYEAQYHELMKRHDSLAASYASLSVSKERQVRMRSSLWWMWLLIGFAARWLIGYAIRKLPSLK